MKKPITVLTAGGYAIQTVSTVDNGSSYRVTHPAGYNIPLEAWDSGHASIRTIDQLMDVLERHGEHLSDKDIARLEGGSRMQYAFLVTIDVNPDVKDDVDLVFEIKNDLLDVFTDYPEVDRARIESVAVE